MSKKNVTMYMETAIIEESLMKFPGKVSQLCEDYLRTLLNHEGFVAETDNIEELKDILHEKELKQTTERNEMNILRAEIKRKEEEADKLADEETRKAQLGYDSLMRAGFLRRGGGRGHDKNFPDDIIAAAEERKKKEELHKKRRGEKHDYAR